MQKDYDPLSKVNTELTFHTTDVSRPLSKKIAPSIDSIMSPITFGALQSPRPNELNPSFNSLAVLLIQKHYDKLRGPSTKNLSILRETIWDERC